MEQLTYQQSQELLKFYEDTFQDEAAKDLEIEIDDRLQDAREQAQANLDGLNTFGGGPRW